MFDHIALLGLGANLGDRLATLQQACTLVAEHSSSLIASPIYETAPVGFTDQGAFLNMAVLVHTPLDAMALFALCKSIEHTLGRKDRPRWHEREIDIDVLLFDDIILKSEQCTIPHPRMHERRFVLEPAVVIAPLLRHPIFQSTLHDLLMQCPDTNAVVVLQDQVSP